MNDRLQRKARILIVERSLTFARLLKSELAHRGFRDIRLAADTGEALGLLADERFDAVLCDNETRPFNGPIFVRAARTWQEMADPYTAIIMTSFAPRYSAVSACRDAGANMFLAKPVSNAELTEKLLASLSEARRFIKAKSYFGPDRRRGERAAYRGLDRRMYERRERIALPPRRAVAD